MSSINRRRFVAGGLLGSVASTSLVHHTAANEKADVGPPKAIASRNGLRAIERAVQLMKKGTDTLDAAIAGVNMVEDDPSDHTVGLGGIPNEEGVVELDSSVMHGPTANGGAVASLRNIKNPSKIAKLVMERTDHVLLVGQGALKFAKAHGFKEEELLTDEARAIWLRWKETLNPNDDWFPPKKEGQKTALRKLPPRATGTIHMSTINEKAELSGVTTTSGLWYKIPGRVGDSPILGAGLFTDNSVGSAGSTGRGEANLLSCASFLVVESMRQGMNPEEACLAACERICETTLDKRLLKAPGKPNFNVNFYALDKKGRHGAAAIYEGSTYAFHDGTQAKVLKSAFLHKKS